MLIFELLLYLIYIYTRLQKKKKNHNHEFTRRTFGAGKCCGCLCCLCSPLLLEIEEQLKRQTLEKTMNLKIFKVEKVFSEIIALFPVVSQLKLY